MQPLREEKKIKFSSHNSVNPLEIVQEEPNKDQYNENDGDNEILDNFEAENLDFLNDKYINARVKFNTPLSLFQNGISSNEDSNENTESKNNKENKVIMKIVIPPNPYINKVITEDPHEYDSSPARKSNTKSNYRDSKESKDIKESKQTKQNRLSKFSSDKKTPNLNLKDGYYSKLTDTVKENVLEAWKNIKITSLISRDKINSINIGKTLLAND